MTSDLEKKVEYIIETEQDKLFLPDYFRNLVYNQNPTSAKKIYDRMEGRSGFDYMRYTLEQYQKHFKEDYK